MSEHTGVSGPGIRAESGVAGYPGPGHPRSLSPLWPVQCLPSESGVRRVTSSRTNEREEWVVLTNERVVRPEAGSDA